MSESSYMVFGNPMPKRAIKNAKKLYRSYARRFQHDPQWQPRLIPGPEEESFLELGIRELVLDPHGGPLDVQEKPVDAAVFSPEQESVSPSEVVIGTIRMGYGHYRIGLALASAARSMGVGVRWLDFLSFPDTCPSRAIHHLENMYNWASRLSRRSKLFNRLVWEKITSDVAQRLTYCVRDRELTRLFAPLCEGLGQLPFVATHPWTASAAVHAGLSRVVTAVPDNFPLAFHLVEGSIHGVQTPSTYLGYRTLRNMGYKNHEFLNPLAQEDIFHAGHFVDHELVSNVELDCQRRFRRMGRKSARRFLLTMGGAGAQVERFFQILRFCRQSVEEGRLTMFVNMGDHRSKWQELATQLDKEGIRYQVHQDWPQARTFMYEVMERDVRGVHVFVYDRIFPSVYSTNLLMRASDVMITKPSELSFYPIPKLFIERVGRHEAWGAIRGAEIGDGTLETQSLKGLYQSLKVIMDHDDLLHMYSGNILKNKQNGMYDGAYNIIKAAVHSREGLEPWPQLKS